MNQPGGAAAPQADGASAAGRKSTASRERLKRSQKITKVEGSEPVPAEASLSAEQGTMTEVKVKTEVPDDYIQEVIWQGEAKEEKKAVSKDGTGEVPAEICVVIGGVRNQQTLGSYECGICGKKYKYYNCFQTHVRAHRDTEATSGEGASQGILNPQASQMGVGWGRTSPRPKKPEFQNPAAPFPGVSPTEMCAHVHQKT